MGFKSSKNSYYSQIRFVNTNKDFGLVRKIDDVGFKKTNELFNKAQLFYVHPDLLKPTPLAKSFDRILALPFPCCYFELTNDKTTLVSIKSEGLPDLEIYAIIVNEVAPGSYEFITFNQLGLAQYSPVGRPQNKTLCNATEMLINALHNKGVYSGIVRNTIHKFKLKGIQKKYQTNIIYVSHKDRIESVKSLDKRTINWSHSWLVRGHWRKYEGTGKDRDGVRCMPNYTWVTEHIKGDGELLTKVRVV